MQPLELRRLHAQPVTSKNEREELREASVSQQKIFEEIHAKLVYDTIGEQLANLIDVAAEGENETKEITITLKKKDDVSFTSHKPTSGERSNEGLSASLRRKS